MRGTTLLWYRDQPEVRLVERPHGSEFLDEYRLSPIAAIIDDGAGGLRHRLESMAPPWPYPILGELRVQGATDYVALPIELNDDRRGSLTLATRRAGGFTTADLELIDGALPALGVVVENLEFQGKPQTTSQQSPAPKPQKPAVPPMRTLVKSGVQTLKTGR
ncbi:hypothetical protein CCP1ISM_7970001 [Azospirillaceae bacterium]